MIPVLHRNRLTDEWNRNEDSHINPDSYIHPTFDKSQQTSIGEKMHPANVAVKLNGYRRQVKSHPYLSHLKKTILQRD